MNKNEPWVTIYDKIPDSIMAVEVSDGNLDEIVTLLQDCVGYTFVANRSSRYVEFQFMRDGDTEPTLYRIAMGDHLVLGKDSRGGRKIVESRTRDELLGQYRPNRLVLNPTEVESVRDILHSLNYSKIAKLKELLKEL